MQKCYPANPQTGRHTPEITPTGQPHHAKALRQALPTLNRVAESVTVRNAG
jgi:hypothetical protein